MLAREKRSSLFRTFVNYGRKSFISLGHRYWEWFYKWGMFHPTHRLFVARNWFQILLIKIWLFFDLINHTLKISQNSKDSKPLLIFFYSFSGCWVFNYFVIFHLIIFAKNIFDPCCHLAAEAGNWLSLMEQPALKNVNSCLNTNIYSYLEISSGQSSNLYLNVVDFFSTSFN
jgi:hypothetical protein